MLIQPCNHFFSLLEWIFLEFLRFDAPCLLVLIFLRDNRMHCQVYGGAFWIYSEVLDRRWVQSLCLASCVYLYNMFNVCSWQQQGGTVSLFLVFWSYVALCSKNLRFFQWKNTAKRLWFPHTKQVINKVWWSSVMMVLPSHPWIFSWTLWFEKGWKRYVLSNIAFGLSMPNFRVYTGGKAILGSNAIPDNS